MNVRARQTNVSPKPVAGWMRRWWTSCSPSPLRAFADIVINIIIIMTALKLRSLRLNTPFWCRIAVLLVKPTSLSRITNDPLLRVLGSGYARFGSGLSQLLSSSSIVQKPFTLSHKVNKKVTKDADGSRVDLRALWSLSSIL